MFSVCVLLSLTILAPTVSPQRVPLNKYPDYGPAARITFVFSVTVDNNFNITGPYIILRDILYFTYKLNFKNIFDTVEYLDQFKYLSTTYTLLNLKNEQSKSHINSIFPIQLSEANNQCAVTYNFLLSLFSSSKCINLINDKMRFTNVLDWVRIHFNFHIVNDIFDMYIVNVVLLRHWLGA